MGRSAWLSSSRWRIAAKKSPGRDATCRSIAVDTRNWLVSASGCASMSFSRVFSDHETKPSGGLTRTTRRCFLTSSPAFASRLAFSTSCSGAWTTT